MKKLIRGADVCVAVLTLVVGIQSLAVLALGVLWSASERVYSQRVGTDWTTMGVSAMVGLCGLVVGIGVLKDRPFAFLLGFLASAICAGLFFSRSGIVASTTISGCLAIYFLVRSVDTLRILS